MSLRTLIVDDEPLARARVRAMLTTQPDVEIVGECGDGREAVQAIRRMRPDLLFLDIQIPELDGFGVLQQVDPERRPVVIFVTAYDQYAIQALDAEATAYLLKPFDRERFERALKRARTQIEQQRLTGARAPERILVKSANRVLFLNIDDIDWIEAARNYLCLHINHETHLMRETMTNIMARLNPDKFLRIHRSFVVNVNRIKELRSQMGGEYAVLMRDGKIVPVSRSYRPQLQRLLHQRPAAAAG